MDANDAARQRAMKAVLAMEDVKRVTESFDQGEINVIVALAALASVCEPYGDLELGRREAG